MGSEEEPAGHELRQAEPLHPPVLQEGYHPQARRLSAARVPICAPRVMQKKKKKKHKTLHPPCDLRVCAHGLPLRHGTNNEDCLRQQLGVNIVGSIYCLFIFAFVFY